MLRTQLLLVLHRRKTEEVFLKQAGHVHPLELGQTVFEFGVDVVNLLLHHRFLAVGDIGKLGHAVLKADTGFLVLHLGSLVSVLGQFEVGQSEVHVLLSLEPFVLIFAAFLSQGMEGLGLSHAGGLHIAVTAAPVDEREVKGEMQEFVRRAVRRLGLAAGRVHIHGEAHVGDVLGPLQHDVEIGQLNLCTENKVVFRLVPAVLPAQILAIKSFENILIGMRGIDFELLGSFHAGEHFQLRTLQSFFHCGLFHSQFVFAHMLL